MARQPVLSRPSESSRPRCILAAVFLLGILLGHPGAVAQVNPELVTKSLEDGIKFLKNQQAANGNWSENQQNPGAITALCTLALLNSGVPHDDPAMKKALSYLRNFNADNVGTTYGTSLHLMVMTVAYPRAEMNRIKNYAKWLIDAQNQGSGGWSYHARFNSDDPSNTQFALLALHEAERVGVPIPAQTWDKAHQYWLGRQQRTGGWSYNANGLATGSMTCAGVASLVITSRHASREAASIVDGKVQCCGPVPDENAIDRGLLWISQAFSVQKNPGSNAYHLYYMYALERVGRMTGQRFFGQHDWYRAGADQLLKMQDKLDGGWRTRLNNNPLTNTAFALLFLSKGRRPVVISKMKYGGQGQQDWDKHRNGVHKLTRFVESRWQQDLTWQTIGINAATLEDLMETPVLFISGYESLALDDQQKTNLRNYVNQGGFLFVEAACGNQAFDTEFRSLMKELFPESPMQTLPPDHPIWFAQDNIAPEFVGRVEGIQSCCRTAVVYVPDNLSCYWSLSQNGPGGDQPEAVTAEINDHLRFAGNVIAYATNRELKRKLDKPRVSFQDSDIDQPRRGTLFVPKLSHGGGSNDAPNSLSNLLGVMRLQLEMRVSTRRQIVQAKDELSSYPILFLHGRGDFQLSENERQSLASYIKRGGFIFADAICASQEFSTAFRREMQLVLAGTTFTRIAGDHPLLSEEFGGYDVTTVTLNDPARRNPNNRGPASSVTVPLLEGLTVEGRLAVVFSPYDMSCALENQAVPECKGYTRDDATRLGTNIILYGLQQ